MAQYVSIDDVDKQLGSDWAAQDQKARAVAMANAWLSAQRIRSIEPVPDEVTLAGVEIAAAAASGDLYMQHTEGALTSKRVKAGDVESEKKYADASASFGKHASLPERIQFALALIEPYRTRAMGITVGHARLGG